MTTYCFTELGITYLLAIMMPGPSIALIIKNAVLYSRLASIKVCFGIMVGIALQSGAILMGLAFVDNDSIFLKIIKILCSLLLIYLGLRILLTKKDEIPESDLTPQNTINIKQWGHFFEGFLVEFLNPLAFTFFVSIMTILINPRVFWGIRIVYWFEIVIIGFVWFFIVAFITSSEKVTFYTRRFNKILQIIAGCVFISFGSQMFVYQ